MRDYLLVRSVKDEAGPTAADVMTAPAVACRYEAFFEEIAEVLADRDISGMPVVDASGRVVGVISERDLAHALGGPMVRLAVRRHNHGPITRSLGEMPREVRRAKDIMTSPPVTVGPDAHLDEIALTHEGPSGQPHPGGGLGTTYRRRDTRRRARCDRPPRSRRDRPHPVSRVRWQRWDTSEDARPTDVLTEQWERDPQRPGEARRSTTSGLET